MVSVKALTRHLHTSNRGEKQSTNDKRTLAFILKTDPNMHPQLAQGVWLQNKPILSYGHNTACERHP